MIVLKQGLMDYLGIIDEMLLKKYRNWGIPCEKEGAHYLYDTGKVDEWIKTRRIDIAVVRWTPGERSGDGGT